MPYSENGVVSRSPEKILSIARARFGRHKGKCPRKRDRDRRRAGRSGAGVALAEFGWQVKLFELRPYLGGRARRTFSPAANTWTIASTSRSLLHESRRFLSPRRFRQQSEILRSPLFLDPQGRSGASRPASSRAISHDGFVRPHSLHSRLATTFIARAMIRILFTAGKPKEVATPAGMSMLDLAEKPEANHASPSNDSGASFLVSALDEELDTHRCPLRH